MLVWIHCWIMNYFFYFLIFLFVFYINKNSFFFSTDHSHSHSQKPLLLSLFLSSVSNSSPLHFSFIYTMVDHTQKEQGNVVLQRFPAKKMPLAVFGSNLQVPNIDWRIWPVQILGSWHASKAASDIDSHVVPPKTTNGSFLRACHTFVLHATWSESEVTTSKTAKGGFLGRWHASGSSFCACEWNQSLFPCMRLNPCTNSLFPCMHLNPCTNSLFPCMHHSDGILQKLPLAIFIQPIFT